MEKKKKKEGLTDAIVLFLHTRGTIVKTIMDECRSVCANGQSKGRLVRFDKPLSMAIHKSVYGLSIDGDKVRALIDDATVSVGDLSTDALYMILQLLDHKEYSVYM